jgi:gluconokinase
MPCEFSLPPILLMGVSGVGKTEVGRQLARRFNVPFLDADSLHSAANVLKMRSETPLTDADRLPWLDRVAAELSRATHSNSGLVVACSALKRAYRDRLRAGAPDLTLVYLTGPVDLIHSRLTSRVDHFMPAALLDSQLAALEPPTSDERPIVADISPTPEENAAWIELRLRGRRR